jgi:methionyl-tRNA synthetase
VWLTVARANEYVDRQAPWKLAKDPASRPQLESTLATLVRQLARQAVYLWPFMPGKSEELWKSLGAPGSPGEMKFKGVKRVNPAGWKVEKGPSLFPKADLVPSGETAR